VKKNNVCVIIEVYNEAHRLENCLKDFIWADELVVFVKPSKDKTYQISKKFASHLYESKETWGNNIVNNYNKHNTKKKWCFYITASSKIDHKLVIEIKKLTSNKSFDFDVIGLPYEMNVFGLNGSFSPWKTDYKYSLIKTESLKLSTETHKEIGWHGDKIYKIMRNETKGRFYHFTHPNPNSFFERHSNYTQREAIQYCQKYGDKAFRKGLIMLFRSLGNVILKRRTIFKGKNGFVLSLAYVSYFIMLLVCIWFNQNNKANIFPTEPSN